MPLSLRNASRVSQRIAGAVLVAGSVIAGGSVVAVSSGDEGRNCMDGTPVNACSQSQPYFCEEAHPVIDTLASDETAVLRRLVADSTSISVLEQFPFVHDLLGVYHFNLNERFNDLVAYLSDADFKLGAIRKVDASRLASSDTTSALVTVLFDNRVLRAPLSAVAQDVYSIDGAHYVRSVHGRLHPYDAEAQMIDFRQYIDADSAAGLQIAYYDISATKQLLVGNGIPLKPNLDTDYVTPALSSDCATCGCPEGAACQPDGSCLYLPQLQEDAEIFEAAEQQLLQEAP